MSWLGQNLASSKDYELLPEVERYNDLCCNGAVDAPTTNKQEIGCLTFLEKQALTVLSLFCSFSFHFGITGFHAIVIPGTLRDSLFLLLGLLEQTTSLQPKEIMTDTAGGARYCLWPVLAVGLSI